MRFLFLAFVVLPIVEMTILIKVGALIGALNTIGLVLLTAVIGAAMLRRQGLATLLRANERLNSGQLPAQEVAEGLLLAVGGALLLTPGFVTDAAGFVCLIPVTRRWLARRVMRRMIVSGSTGQSGFDPFGRGPFQGAGRSPFEDDEVVIEGEYSREDRERRSSSANHLEEK